MSSQLSFADVVSRPCDGETSRAAAHVVEAGNGDLIAAIRRAVRFYSWASAFEIAQYVGEHHRNVDGSPRWMPDTVRSACARAGLKKLQRTSLSPRGRICCVYALDEHLETVRVKNGRI